MNIIEIIITAPLGLIALLGFISLVGVIDED